MSLRRAAARRRALSLVAPLAILMFTSLALPATTLAHHNAPYAKLEHFTLRLINCTRTGGWVQKDGSCKDYGSGKHSKYRPPIKFSYGIAADIARPYAVKTATADYCWHDLGGRTITHAFRHAGYMGDHYGESIGCSTRTPKATIIHIHLWMQDEKSSNGWHWRNFKNPDWKVVGVGVAVVHGQVRFLEDYYGNYVK